MSVVTDSTISVIAKPPTYGIASISSRETLAANLRALMAANPALGTTTAVEKATEANGMKVGKSTVDRLCKGKTPVNLDYIEVLALVFHLDPWQLMVPGLDPKSPPTLRSVSASEEALYKRLRELALKIVNLNDNP